MIKDSQVLIWPETKLEFQKLLSHLPSEHKTLINDTSEQILSRMVRGVEIYNFGYPVRNVEYIFMRKMAGIAKETQLVLRQALVAQLALNLPAIVEKLFLPKSILMLYPDAFERLAIYLKNDIEKTFGPTDDFYCKDICFVLGYSIPCGAQVVDVNSNVRIRSVIISTLRMKKLGQAYRYFLAKGSGPWFRIHTESRFLGDFNEKGWDKCYLRIVEMLKQNGNIRGMVGTSWFYDPQLLQISPNLAYLQKRPLLSGAFLLRHGTHRFDIENATKVSKTRLRLYKEGKYRPICYSLLWPRKNMIAWGEQYTQESGF